MNSFSFTVLLALSLMASSSVALPTGKDRSLSPHDMNRVMEAVRKALPGPPPAEDQEGVQDLLRQALIKNKASPRQSGGGDDGDVALKSFESRLTIFLSYSFIQRARTRGALVLVSLQAPSPIWSRPTRRSMA